jgi:hypothetical protein
LQNGDSDHGKQQIKPRANGTSDGQPNQREEIAVIGMACRFPQADTLEQFWQLISNGKMALSKVPWRDLPLVEFVDNQRYLIIGAIFSKHQTCLITGFLVSLDVKQSPWTLSNVLLYRSLTKRLNLPAIAVSPVANKHLILGAI